MGKWRIAIASSGLGHVRRGVESWAEDLGKALHRSGENVTLYQADGRSDESWQRTLWTLRRFEAPNSSLLSWTRKAGGWRYGFGNEYEIEQSTFAWSLWKAVRSAFDIVHVQDPLVALQLDWLNRRGLSKARVILAHGTEEPVARLQRYRFLQHLAPNYDADWGPYRPLTQLSFAVPNFVDVEKFSPGDTQAARIAFGLPADALIVLSVAALKKHHKRCDYLIREFAAFRREYAGPALLIIAGAREKETEEIIALGRELLGDSVRIFEALDRQKLSTLYRAADIFALASLHEMMPIALLEALSSGLPISCNSTPTLRWMAGPSGVPEDISQPGGMVRQWNAMALVEARSEFARKARQYAESTFSEPVVMRQITAMYDAVMKA